MRQCVSLYVHICKKIKTYFVAVLSPRQQCASATKYHTGNEIVVKTYIYHVEFRRREVSEIQQSSERVNDVRSVRVAALLVLRLVVLLRVVRLTNHRQQLLQLLKLVISALRFLLLRLHLFLSLFLLQHANSQRSTINQHRQPRQGPLVR